MYLSGRDIKWAIDCGRLIVRPRPEELGPEYGYDETSIDLHLDHVREAKVWDVAKLMDSEDARGNNAPEVKIARVSLKKFAARYLRPVSDDTSQPVFLRGSEVVVKPNGFLLWQTREWVETPKKNPGLICFVDGKSTRARTGIVVHLTAPTIHSGWGGHITLEIANLGPFHFVLHENDSIAQLTVAMIAGPPDVSLKTGVSATQGQTDVSGGARRGRQPRSPR